MSPWEFKSMWIPLLSQLIHFRASRITKPHCSCHFVKCLSSSIIPCSSNYLIRSVIINLYKMSVSTRYNKSCERRFKFLILHIISAYVSLNVMHSNKRLPSSICKSLSLRYSYKERSYKSRSIGHRNGRYIIKCNPCLLQSKFYNPVNILNMLS